MVAISRTSATSLELVIEEGKPPILPAPKLRDMASTVRYVEEIREAVRAELSCWGHLLIRGLPVRNSGDFAQIRDLIIGERTSYKEQATPRSDFGDDVFSSTDFPADQAIRLHNENSYTLDFPGILLFCSVEAAAVGGATTVGDVREVLAALPADLVARFREHGWLLTRNYRDLVGLPWRTAFSTDQRSDAEAYCDRNLVGYRWLPDNDLSTVQRRSALIRHPDTHEEVWFNHVVFWSRWSLAPEVREALTEMYGEDGLPFDTAYGDGTPLSRDEVEAIDRAYELATRREGWQVGDVMLVDNILSTHGRESYSGQRKTLVAMGEPVALSDCAPTVEPSASPGQ